MKLNKIICIFCAVLILVITCANISISAFASDDEDITFVESTKEEVLDFLYEYMIISAKSNVISFELFCNMVNDEWGWTWDADDSTLTDVQTGVVYGITLDSAGLRGLARSGRSGGGGRRRVTSGEDIEISGETFADICSRLKEQYAPDILADTFRLSRATEKRWSSSTSAMLSFYTNTGGFAGKGLDEIYLVPFYEDENGVMYYSQYQLHYTLVPTYNDTNTQLLTNYLRCEITSYFDDTFFNEWQASNSMHENLVRVPFMDIRFCSYGYGCHLLGYTTYSNYISHTSDAWLEFTGYDFLNELYAPDKMSIINIKDVQAPFLTDTFSGDLGYIASASPIPMDNPIPDVEPDKIDPDATVKMTGDTIYDYTITNTTGDTTTFNEYVTNNYTYITNNGSDDSGNSSGGSVSGDVNVNGEIAVGGQVDVNVNINENSNTSMPVEVDVDNYIEVLPEQAKPVTNILALFFDFLPVELMSLVLAGVAVAIILRIWGR